MGESNYVVWDVANLKNMATLGELGGFEDDWELVEGTPLAESWPKKVFMRIDHEGDLVDNLFNTNRIVVVSKKLHSFLQEQDLPEVEFLPISIRPKKGSKAEAEYTIVHPIDAIECIDIKSSKVKWHKIADDEIRSFKKLILDEAKIDRPLFRTKFYYDHVFVRRDLAATIGEGGFSAIEWKEISTL